MTWYGVATVKRQDNKKKGYTIYSYNSSHLLMPRGSIVLVCGYRVGFTCFPERIAPIFKFFNRNQKHMIVEMIAG